MWPQTPILINLVFSFHNSLLSRKTPRYFALPLSSSPTPSTEECTFLIIFPVLCSTTYVLLGFTPKPLLLVQEDSIPSNVRIMLLMVCRNFPLANITSSAYFSIFLPYLLNFIKISLTGNSHRCAGRTSSVVYRCSIVHLVWIWVIDDLRLRVILGTHRWSQFLTTVCDDSVVLMSISLSRLLFRAGVSQRSIPCRVPSIPIYRMWVVAFNIFRRFG